MYVLKLGVYLVLANKSTGRAPVLCPPFPRSVLPFPTEIPESRGRQNDEKRRRQVDVTVSAFLCNGDIGSVSVCGIVPSI